MRNPATLYKLKYNGYTKREREVDLVDADGEWLVCYFTPPRHRSLRDGEPTTHYESPHILFFLSTAQPLNAMFFFDDRGELTGAYVDAALPARITGRSISYVDLDLDIVAQSGREPFVKDEDVFAEHSRTMAYTPEVVAAAWEGIRIGQSLIARGEYPFDGSAGTILGRVLASEGPL